MMKGTREKRIRLRQDEKYIVEAILPAGELHLVGGASGIGKTTWLLQWLRDWSEGKPIWGHESFPCPFVYISFDRGVLTTDRTLRRIGMEDWDFPAYDVSELGLVDYEIWDIVKRFPEARLFVIEGFQALLPDTTKGRGQNKEEMLWSVEVRRKILSLGITIIGITHSPKMKQGEAYASTRSRFLGSNSLLASTGTLISFDVPEDSKNARKPSGTDERQVLIEGPNFRQMTLHYSRGNDGRFVPMEEAHQKIKFDVFVEALEGIEEISKKELEALAPGVSSTAVKNWINALIDDGTLERTKARGVYKKRKVN